MPCRARPPSGSTEPSCCGASVELRQPEVQDLGEAVLRDHHVLGFQVPMRRCRRSAPWQVASAIWTARSRSFFVGRGSSGRDELAQGLPLDRAPWRCMSSRQPRRCRRSSRCSGGSGRRPNGLPARNARAVLYRRRIPRQHLERHFASQPQVAGTIDLPHAPGAEAREHFERTDSAARRKIHAGKSRSGAGDNRKSRIRQSDFRNSTRSAFCDGDSFSSSTRS